MNESPHTSAFIKNCLADALIRLLAERRIEDITVMEIVTLAGYHRAS